MMGLVSVDVQLGLFSVKGGVGGSYGWCKCPEEICNHSVCPRCRRSLVW